MAVKRLGVLLFSHILLLLLALLLAGPSIVFSAVTPDREIVPVDAPKVPLWKNYWDAGREMAREGNYPEAAIYYKELITQKPQIEQAKWEYCKVLFELLDFDTAAPLLESLIEGNPYRMDYLEMAGHVALERGEYERVVKFLGQVFSHNPEGKKGIESLTGLIRGLQGMDKKLYAFPLMEQLNLRQPGDKELLHTLAQYSAELGSFDKARDYYSQLVEQHSVSRDVFIEFAEMLSATGMLEDAAPYWQRVVEKDPAYLPYHRNLLDYYIDRDERQKGLANLLSIIKYDPDYSAELLLVAGRIYMQDMSRADKALNYYERYLERVPGDIAAINELDTVRQAIATELLSIVENDGAELLWGDLKKLTKDSLTIFSLMAEKLEMAKKTAPLLKVLEILYANTSGKDNVGLKLSDIYSSAGNSEKAYYYFKEVRSASYRNAAYYQKKGALEEKLGLWVEALDSYLQALKRSPETAEIRKRSIEISGELGLLAEMEKLAQPLIIDDLLEKDFTTIRLYLRGLRQNGQFNKAGQLYDTLLQVAWLDEMQRQALLFDKAEALLMMGEKFEALQIYRQQLVSDPKNHEAAYRLLEYSAAAGLAMDARALFWYLAGQQTDTGWQTNYTMPGRRLFFAHISILQAERKRESAIDELQTYIQGLNQQLSGSERLEAVTSAEFLLCRLYLEAEEWELAEKIMKPYADQQSMDIEMRLLMSRIGGKGLIDSKKTVQAILEARNSSGGIRNLFYTAQKTEDFGDRDIALACLDNILQLHPQSVRARVMRADLLRRTGRSAESIKIYSALKNDFPGEPYYSNAHLQSEFKSGNYSYVLDSLSGTHSGKDLSPELQLLQARSHWAMANYQQALSVYTEMLSSPVGTLLQEKLTEQKLHLKQPEESQIFWGLFSYTYPDQLDMLNSLNQADGFLSLLKRPEGVIAADLYARYRWEKLVRNEYLARKAVQEKRYIAAEKQYTRTREDEKSTEGLIDLARIYERLGDYGKEAEIYSELERQGEKSPGLEESILRNRLTRSPTLAFNYLYLQKEGRDSAVDLEKKRIGTGIRFMPQLSSEIEIDYAELIYNPRMLLDEELNGREMKGSAKFEISPATTALLDMGFHMLDSDGDTTLVYGFRLDHEFDDILSVYTKIDKRVVDDTIAALNQALYSESLSIGSMLESDSGLTVGGEYRRLNYSDDNEQDRLYFWSAYSIFSEYTTFELKYSYQLVKNSDFNILSVDPGSGGVINSLPYWSPENYWQNLIRFRFYHLLKSFDAFERAPSYYSLDFSAGYDSEELYTYTGEFDIFLEMSTNYLLKGNLLYTRSSDYDERSATFSLMYRW